MSLVLWLKIVIKLRVKHKENLSVNSPILVRTKSNDALVPMTGFIYE